MKGMLAWLGWRSILWSVVPSRDRRLRLIADWMTWPLVGRDIVQMGPSEAALYDVRHHVYQEGETIADSARPVRLVHVIVEGDVDLLRRGDGSEEVLESIGPGDHFGRKLLEFKKADLARARSLVRTLALREEQANQLQDVFLSTGRIVARTELLPTIDAEALERERKAE
jgi:CRP-like cAMP-binding protein